MSLSLLLQNSERVGIHSSSLCCFAQQAAFRFDPTRGAGRMSRMSGCKISWEILLACIHRTHPSPAPFAPMACSSSRYIRCPSDVVILRRAPSSGKHVNVILALCFAGVVYSYYNNCSSRWYDTTLTCVAPVMEDGRGLCVIPVAHVACT